MLVLVDLLMRKNPKHLCPKMNGYGDNWERKVWSSIGSTHYNCQLEPYRCLTLSAAAEDIPQTLA
jgi:hypothetical protein